jgi:hypothetical protein
MTKQTEGKQSIQRALKRLLENRWTRLLFSLAIIASAVPDVIADFSAPSGSWTHWGMLLIGLGNLVENVLWIGDVWTE